MNTLQGSPYNYNRYITQFIAFHPKAKRNELLKTSIKPIVNKKVNPSEKIDLYA